MPEGVGYPEDEKMAAEAAQGAEAPAEGGGADDIAKGMKAIEESMLSLGAAVEEAGAPPEALEALNMAIKSYGEFLSIVTGAAGGPEGSGAPASEMAQGAQAVPADTNQAPGSRPA